MSGFPEIKAAIDRQGEALEGFMKRNQPVIDGIAADVASLGDRVEELETRASTPRKTEGKARTPEPGYRTLYTSGGQKAFVLPSKARLSDVPELQREAPVSLDRWCSALVFGANCGDREAVEFLSEQKAVSTGSTGVLIPESFVTQWIDMARAASVLIQAGMQTVTMPDQSMTFSHQTADPTLAWRASEGASLSATDPTFAARVLTAKTIAVRTQVSLEASQDIPGFGEQITSAYTRAFASAIDQAGTAGTGDAPTGLHDTAGVTKITSVGTPADWDDIVDGAAAFLNANNRLEELTGIIMHPDLWKVYAKLKTGITGDATPLELPPAIAGVPRFVTTNADAPGSPPTYHIVMGNFRDLTMGVRMNPTIRILDSTTSMASNLLVEIIGVARVDFLATRPASFVVLEDVTTS